MNKTAKLYNAAKISISAIVILSLIIGIFYAANVMAAAGQGTATIGGGASQTVEISSSTVFTTVLTVGALGIATDAGSPTFTIPIGFTAPHAAGGAVVPTQVSEVDVDGEWFVAGAGGACAVTMGSSSAAGQVITVDVTVACVDTNTITLTYKGSASGTASAAAALNIATDDVAPADATNIASPPTLVVKGTAVFANHATAGVATTNNLAGKAKIGGADLVLGGFKITAAGENVAVTTIRTTVTLGTMTIGELTNLRIVADNGAGGGVADDGTMQAGELAAALATIASPASGNNDFTVTSTVTSGSSNNYFIVGTIASTVSDADTLDVEATGAGSVSSGATSLVAITPTGTSTNSLRTITDTTAPTLSSAKFTSLTTLQMTFSEDIGLAATVDETKITLTNNTGDAIAVTDNSAVVSGNNVTVTVANVGSTSFKIDDAAQGLDLAAAAVQDLAAVPNTNIEDLNNGVADGIVPTFTAARTALNTIVLTFSENVDASDTATAAWTVAGAATTSLVTDPANSTTLTITTTGLTATDGTPAITYVAASGTVVDMSAAANEVANGVGASAADQVSPTLVSAKITAANEITVVYSEAVTSVAGDYTGLILTAGGARNVDSRTGSGTATIVLTFSGAAAATSDTATINIGQTVVDTSVAANAFGGIVGQAVTDGYAPTFTAARTALNTIVLTFSENVDAADTATAAWTVAGATVDSVTDPGSSTTLTITTTGLTSTSSTPEVNYVAAQGTVKDVSAALNEVANGGAVSAADQVKPTFTAVRSALNTIVLTFSEPVTGTAIADSFTVAGASSVTNTAPTGETTVTLTTVGLTATNGTPAVGYVAGTGNIVDNSAALNEVADGGAVSAVDNVKPTFTAVRTALNTIVLTFSENVDVTTTNGAGYAVAGGTVTANTDPAGSSTSMTLTTTGLTATDGAPAVTYTIAAGTTLDASAAANEVANDFSANAADQVKPTFTAARTALNTIVLTFSENVNAPINQLTAWTVDGATVTATTAVTAGTSMTITTTGLTSTSSTPAVAYVALNGDVLDTSAATNEMADATTANAADNVAPTFTAARTALNTIVLTFSENVDASDTATAAWTVEGASVDSVTDPESSTTLTIATSGLTSTSSTPAVNYVAGSGTVKDVSAALNEVADGGAVAAADQVAPTFTAVRSALNTIVLTFSEPVTGTAIAGSFTVAGADAGVTNTAPTANTTVTLTTVGLTATSGTPAVGYVLATGDIKDVSVAQNEVANGGAVSAVDNVAPTFTAARTALNTIVLTFSENVNEPAGETTAWTVAGATVGIVPGVVAGTTMTITTSGLTATNGTPAVTYIAANGNLLDASGATNEMANATTANAADQIKPTLTSAKITGANAITVVYSEPVTSVASDYTSLVLVAGGARSVTDVSGSTTATIVLTFDGAAAATSDTATMTIGATVKDTSTAQNTFIAIGGRAVTDGYAPTFTAARTALNTIVLTFSENVNAPVNQLTAWTVAGASVSATTAVTSGTSMTITTTGLTATNGTPAVTYIAANGDVLDVSAATNEMANATTANAADQVKPTFTAARTGLNTIVLTFSENVDVTTTNGAGYALSDGGSVSENSDPAGTSNIITLTTTGITGTTATPTVTYTILAGTTLDTSANEVADTVNAVASDAVSPTFTASRTGLNTIVLTFSENVNVTTVDGSGYALSTGTVTGNTDPAGSSNAITLTTSGVTGTSATPTVTYTIAAGTTTDTIGNEVANDASAVAGDAVSPTFTAATASTTTIIATFSENVNSAGDDSNDWTVAGNTVSSISTLDGTGSTLTITLGTPIATNAVPNVTYTATTGDIQDSVPNAVATATVTPTDGTKPTVVSSKITGANEATVVYSEPVITVFGDYTDLKGAIGARNVTARSGNGTITIVLTFDGTATATDGVGTIDIGATVTDLSSNTLVALNDQVLSDGRTPTFTASRTGVNTIVLTFSEAVTASDTATAAWTLTEGTVFSVTQPSSSTTLTITTTGITGTTETPTVTYVAGSGTVVDAASNEVADTATAVASDAVSPTTTITDNFGGTTAKDPVTFTFTFSEAVNGFTVGEVVVTGGTKAGAFASGSDGSSVYTLVITPTAATQAGTIAVDVAAAVAQDAALNNNTIAVQATQAYDTLAPTVGVVVTDTALKIGDTSLVTFTFSEVVTGFANDDLIIENGTLTPVSSTDGGTVWNATFTPGVNITDTTNLITINKTGVLDAASNAGVGTTDSNNYAIDTKAPTVALTYSADPAKAGAMTVTATYSETVTTPSISIDQPGSTDITTQAMSGSGAVWTYAYTVVASSSPTYLDGTATVSLSADADAAGNAAADPTAPTFVIDTTGPDFYFTNPTAGSTISSTFQLAVDTDGTAAGCEYKNASFTYGTGTNMTVSGSTSYTASLSGISTGNQTYYVICADSATNTVTRSRSFIVGTDTTAPAGLGITTADATVNSDYYTISGTLTADANDVTIQVLDVSNAAYGTVIVPAGQTAWSVVVSLPQSTATTYHANAVDPSSNALLSTANSNVSLTTAVITEDASTGADVTAPPVPVITTANATVNADTYSITGTAAADTPSDTSRTIVLYNGATQVASISLPIGQTAWSVFVPLTQSSANVFTAYSYDVYGNNGSASASITITESATDVTAPTITASGPSGTDTDGAVTLTATTDENATCRYDTTDTSYASMTGNFTGSTTTHTAALTLTNGNYNYYVRCTDGTNIMTSSSVIGFTVTIPADTTAPTVTLVSAVPAQTTAVVTFQSNESGTGSVAYGISDSYGSQTSWQSVTASTNKTITLSGLTCGTTYHYKIYAKDAALNEGSVADATFDTTACSDTTAPRVIASSPSSLINDSTPTLYVKLDSTDNVNTSSCKYSTSAFDFATGGTAMTWNGTGFAVTLPVQSDGTKMYYVLCEDTANNLGTLFPLSYIVNTAGLFNYVQDLDPNWNRLDLPVNLSGLNGGDTTWQGVLGNVSGSHGFDNHWQNSGANWDTVYHYDAVAGEWKVQYRTGDYAGMGTLTDMSISSQNLFWIIMTAADRFQLNIHV